MATFQHFPTPLYPFAPLPPHVVPPLPHVIPPPSPFHPIVPPPRVLPPPPPFHPIAPPPRVLPPPPPFHPIAPPPRVLPPPPPFHPIAPPPHVLPPPPPFHPIVPPPHVLPPPPAPTPDNGSTVIIVAFISFGGFFFAAFCCFAMWCFIKRRKEKKMISETDMIRTDEHLRVKEAIVQGPNGPEVVILSIEDDIHTQEEIIKNEKMETMHSYGKAKSGEIAANDHHLEAGKSSSNPSINQTHHLL